MRTLRSLLVLVTLVSLASVSQAQDTPPQMAAADVTRWLGFFDKLVVTVTKTQGACERMASDVSSLVDANKSAIEIARAARAKGQKLPESAQQHMLEGVKKMVPAMQKCGQNEKVRAAFAKLDLNRK